MEAHEKLQDLRQRVLRNQEVSAAEYKELLDDIREERLSAGAPKEKKSPVILCLEGFRGPFGLAPMLRYEVLCNSRSGLCTGSGHTVLSEGWPTIAM